MKFKKVLAIALGLCVSVSLFAMAACSTASADEKEFRGHIEVESGYEGYTVKKDVMWEEDGQLYGLMEGDVIGIHGDVHGIP